MHIGWTGYLMLRSKRSIRESGRECIGLGHAVGSLIVLGSLQLAYKYSEFVFDFE
jgi:hypothetical protein